ncbi:MAG: UDP-N-acetylenolpyruvoylglucosamine reductase [Deltaproteobacteria bacterium GWA2_38_16]|nr:MAG: UDP-N-acetylenolpyruvoylglucosamine reductase [Deltaproteobacteria bacterium GWA2_38_16]OGQ02419.1 MAG: UDP-N-acetylenolpyruvoylglucosamine reductase [Deltaproteobacteria bacterium RIFCSPHIGHO2_02_FULL_38_15]OGQ60037.1 MAG: UDP-N-acetylenolpyruvoylglucosamine reductase [Deltaproteobacteria bacterium RIFCSPLOWO2_12_FULL_38_8]
MPVKLVDILSGLQSKILWNEPLALHTSFKVGGPADAFIYPKNSVELSQLMKKIDEHKIPYFVLGDGSNLVMPDEGYRGVVINLSLFDEIKIIHKDDEKILVKVGAGVLKQKLLFWSIEQGFSGLEFLAGVPGQVGGGIFMNAGTKGGSFCDITEKIFMINTNGELEEQLVTKENFSYRSQNFCKNKIMMGAILRLHYGDKEKMMEVVKTVIAERKAIQPLNFPNCGSVFKNPKGYYAGKLIEDAGLKGYRVGHAQISTKHGNFIVNLGGAAAKDIVAIIEHAKKRVKEVHGVTLEEEVIIVHKD